MESQKNTRRKRKDHESRDFTCRCGKSYLSYAAAYTHVKNKHNLQKEFLDDIGKPERQKLPRGRPKEKKYVESSIQIEELSLIEEAILRIYQLLHNKFAKAILEGNSKQHSSIAEDAFLRLADSKEYLKVRISDQAERFVRDISKHFSAEVSSRVRLVILTFSTIINEEGSENAEVKKRVIDQLNAYDLWRGENEVNTVIYQTFVKWLSVGNG